MNGYEKMPPDIHALVHALCGMCWTGRKWDREEIDLNAYTKAYRKKHKPIRPTKLHKPTVKELKTERNKKIIEMHNSDASYPEICHALNVSRSAVQQIIWRYNKG
jgi:DNA-directed RNA polymerase specialized sigma subunit